MIEKFLHYKDIALVPEYFTGTSRSVIDTSVTFLGATYNLPVVPSNMQTTISFHLARELSTNGYFYILHRFYPYDDILDWIRDSQDLPIISISVGVKEVDQRFIKMLFNTNYRVDIITVDVAHGFSRAVRDMVFFIRKYLPKTKIIAGNVFGDVNSICFMQTIRVDAIKIGLSYGAGCTTYDKTGFASPMFTCGLEASDLTDIPLIGDGGIRTNGDIAKAVACGYDMVMVGGMFASCLDSPAETICGKKHYYGSASARNKGYNKHVEGREVLLDCNEMTYLQKLEEIKQDLQSAISYAGGSKLADLCTIEFCQV